MSGSSAIFSGQLQANSVYFDESGVRSWTFTKSSGNLLFGSGDNSGTYKFTTVGASTSTTTGAVTVAGGVGIGGALFGTSATFSGSLIGTGAITTNANFINSGPVYSTTGNVGNLLFTNTYPSNYNVAQIASVLDGYYYASKLVFRTADQYNANLLVDRLTIASTGAVTFSSLTTGAVYSTSGSLTNTAPSITATGGTIVTSGGFKYHTFNSSGTFQVTAGSGLVEVFVLAGGGGGGGDESGGTFYAGGGGAGGGVYNQGYYVEVASYTVTVGAGGVGNAGSDGYGANGNNSVFGLITAIGGGGGSRGNIDSANSNLGKNGGSGGGGGSSNGVAGITTQSIGTGVPYGNNGGIASSIGGGGGGIGTTTSCSYGGLGKYIFNLASRIGGGGGGGMFADVGSNGNDGGGRGGYWGGASGNTYGRNGTANTGGGGGGIGYPTATGGTGGSGIVIVRYKV